jgi:hypothetical protein
MTEASVYKSQPGTTAMAARPLVATSGRRHPGRMEQLGELLLRNAPKMRFGAKGDLRNWPVN